MRPAALIWIALIATVMFGMFMVKYEVRDLDEGLADLDRQIVADREAVHVLRAEWSYLNRPERLADLADRHLELQPVDPSQIGSIEEIPFTANTPGDTEREAGATFATKADR